MAYLTRDGHWAHLALDPRGSVIGRQPGVEITLTDAAISRRHARIWRDHDAWHVEDLGSRAGLRVDGHVSTRAALSHGAVIELGAVRLVFHDPPVHAPTEDGVREVPIAGNSLLQTLAGAPPAGTPAALTAILTAGERLRGCNDVEAVIRALLDVTAAAARATSAWLLRFEPDGGESMTSLHDEDRAPSRTFVARVVDARAALLVTDTHHDPTLKATKSLILGGRRSLMCAPLWDGDRVAGVLYLESTVGPFKASDVDVAVGIGYLAAAEIRRMDVAARLAAERAHKTAILRFLPPQLADALQHDALDAAIRTVAVVAVDLAGHDTADGSDAVDALLDVLIGVAVDACGGTLLEASPTAVRFAFGAPTSAGPEADAQRAAKAAIQLVRAMEDRRTERRAWGPVRLRVGIHVGEALVGWIGPARRREYRAVGAGVDGAVAAAAASVPGRVLASGAVVAALEGRIEAVPEPGLLPDGPGFWLASGR